MGLRYRIHSLLHKQFRGLLFLLLHNLILYVPLHRDENYVSSHLPWPAVVLLFPGRPHFSSQLHTVVRFVFLLANKLAEGALVAWKVPTEKLEAAFEFLFKQDPFSGHVVLRSTDREVSGSDYRLWTTLKVPQGYDINQHCDVLAKLIGAESYYTMEAHGIFALGVGHVRRKTLENHRQGPAQSRPRRRLAEQDVPQPVCRSRGVRTECSLTARSLQLE